MRKIIGSIVLIVMAVNYLKATGISFGIGTGVTSYGNGTVGASLEVCYVPVSFKLLVTRHAEGGAIILTPQIICSRGFLMPYAGMGLGMQFSKSRYFCFYLPIGCKFRLAEHMGVETTVNYGMVFKDSKISDFGLFIGIYYHLL